MTLKAVNKSSASEQVFDQMKENIITGVWKRGAKIPSETDLAHSFGVSRNTVRGCIQKLSAIGVLVVKHGEGTFVCDTIYDNLLDSFLPVLQLEDDELIEMLEFRKVLESAYVRMAAVNAEEEDLKRIKKCLDEMVRYRNDYEKYAYADLNFHINIAAASKNRMFYKTMLKMKEILFSHFQKNTAELLDSFDGEVHEKVYNAIKDRDQDAAQKYIEYIIDKNISLIKQSN